jgi:hypothetical protein
MTLNGNHDDSEIIIITIILVRGILEDMGCKQKNQLPAHFTKDNSQLSRRTNDMHNGFGVDAKGKETKPVA